jgi:hypothetical protein
MAAPKWIFWAGLLALLWNLMGLVAIGADTFMGDKAMAGLTEAQRLLALSTPLWAKLASWTAVTTGTMGCVGLMMRREWCVGLFAVSLLGVLVQHVWMFALSDTLSLYGSTVGILQGLVLVIAVTLLLVARRARANRWLR